MPSLLGGFSRAASGLDADGRLVDTLPSDPFSLSELPRTLALGTAPDTIPLNCLGVAALRECEMLVVPRVLPVVLACGAPEGAFVVDKGGRGGWE